MSTKRRKTGKKKPATTALALRTTLPATSYRKHNGASEMQEISEILADLRYKPATGPIAYGPGPEPMTKLSDETSIGVLGAVTLTLKPREEAVLARPVNVADIRMKPSGQPYLSHPTYTKLFNEAFGRLHWALVPASKPTRTDKGVARDFLLTIHGKPVAHATGEQDYHESNKEQSYVDALEACYASALRRVAKRIGVGLEMWDRAFIDAYIHEHCLCVRVKGYDGKIKERWRRKLDPNLRGEIGVADDVDRDGDDTYQHAQRRTSPPPPPTREATESDELKITVGTKEKPGQVRRLWVILRNSGRSEQVFKDWLKKRYGYASTKDIKRKHYDEICRAVESQGGLP